MSLTDTGLAVTDHESNLLLQKSIKTKASMPDIKRCIYIADTLMGMIDPYIQGHKVRVFIEDIPFARMPTGKTFTRHQCLGMIKYLLQKANVETYLISATTLKSQLTGNGSAKKHDIQAAIYNRFHVLIKNDNVADAIGLTAIGADYHYKKKRFSIIRLPLT